MVARGRGGSKARGDDPLLESWWPLMRGHPAVPRRSSCAAKALTVDLAAPNVGGSIARSIMPDDSYSVHRGSTYRTTDPNSPVGSQVRFAVTAAGVSIEQPGSDRPARTVLEMTDTRRLPKPVANEWDWQLKGSCQGLNSSVFFHPDGERGSARSRRADRAKAICQRCPVLEQCRRHALAAREPYGVWGGLTEEERRELWTSERELLVS
jgi:WhiB family transcriptional regulator, redox-sensing transcriptional regulator